MKIAILVNYLGKGPGFAPDVPCDILPDKISGPRGPLRDIIFRPVYLTPRYDSSGALINCEAMSCRDALREPGRAQAVPTKKYQNCIKIGQVFERTPSRHLLLLQFTANCAESVLVIGGHIA